MIQPSKCSSSMRVASGTISSQETSGLFESVTKSADMKTLVTPASARSGDATGSSMSTPAAKLLGESNSAPTVNLRAFGLGVGVTETGMILLGVAAAS